MSNAKKHLTEMQVRKLRSLKPRSKIVSNAKRHLTEMQLEYIEVKIPRNSSEQRQKTFNQDAVFFKNFFKLRRVSEQRQKTFNQDAGQTLQAMFDNR